MQVTRREFIRRLGSRSRLARIAGFMTQGLSEIAGPLRRRPESAESAGRALGDRIIDRPPPTAENPAALAPTGRTAASDMTPNAPRPPARLDSATPAEIAGSATTPTPAPTPRSRQSAILLAALQQSDQ